MASSQAVPNESGIELRMARQRAAKIRGNFYMWLGALVIIGFGFYGLISG